MGEVELNGCFFFRREEVGGEGEQGRRLVGTKRWAFVYFKIVVVAASFKKAER